MKKPKKIPIEGGFKDYYYYPADELDKWLDEKMGEEKIIKIIEKYGMYLTPEFDAFSMHKTGVKKLAQAIRQHFEK